MTKNMEMVLNLTKTVINTKYIEKLPTEDQIYDELDTMRATLSVRFPLSDEEYAELKKYMPSQIRHSIGFAKTLVFDDGIHQKGWYFTQSNDSYFWNRYKVYLGKKWDTEQVSRLDKTTDEIMDNLGDPKSEEPFRRFGLLLGDVQSGKTSTYIGLCNKAADVGYKVIIVLAGMMENLRIQTQERLDSDFIGVDSKYTFDKKADTSMKNLPVGVGLEPPFDSSKHITPFTTVATDFSAKILRDNKLNLNDLNGTALFVVKKNKSVLNNLHKWLTKDEEILNLPLLMIDDEADNASVNTKKVDPETEPTAINLAINKILKSFKQATYVGITATPFANIFIDPSINDDGSAADLFPRHFLTMLPIPDHYIGTDKIFGNGDLDSELDVRIEGQYTGSLIPIMNSEQEAYYVFKHKKELADELFDIPVSLKEAVRYFILATSVSDARFDNNQHRSMLVNVSRFTKVQTRTKELIEEYVFQLNSDVQNYSQLSPDKADEITNIHMLKSTWEKYHLSEISSRSWENILKDYLPMAIKRIVVRDVNQSTGARSLDYYNYKKIGMRVIAVGGNSLSRGLTLEGLCVSYFYRNTMMYDTLLQMGRWFGYRDGYDDLFKIWMGEDAIEWYGYITDAVNEFKSKLDEMNRQGRTPEDFGLRVRQDPGYLIVTARNKMRRGTIVNVPITLAGKMVETPRLWDDPQIIKDNNELCMRFIKDLSTVSGVKESYEKHVNSYVWRNVPREYVADLIKDYRSHVWNLNFQAGAIYDYIMDDTDEPMWDVGIPMGTYSAGEMEIPNGITVIPEPRPFSKDQTTKKMLKVNDHHVRIGAGGCAKIGLSEEKIKEIRKNAGKAYDKDYLKVKDRNPILLLHFVHNTTSSSEYPDPIVCLGLGFPGVSTKTATYVINPKELEQYIDVEEADEDDFIQ